MTLRVAAEDENQFGTTEYAANEHAAIAPPQLRYDYELHEFVVNTAGDAGDANPNDATADSDANTAGVQITLRSALDRISQLQATSDKGKYVIRFAPQITSINLVSTLIIPSGNVTIEGPGSEALTINAATIGSTTKRAFLIDSPANVKLAGMTITGGSVPSGLAGAGIYSWGNLTLDGVVLTNNVVANGTSGSGGAIYSWRGNLRILNSTIADNQAKYGGGIHVTLTSEDSLEIRNSVIRDNATHANGTGGGVYLRADLGSAVDIAGSSIVGNKAGWQGGGLLVERGEVRVSETVIANNSAGFDGVNGVPGGGVVWGVGGGVYAIGNGLLKIVASTINDNKVYGDYSTAAGMFANKRVALEDSTIDGNRAEATTWSEGGGLFIVSATPDAFQATRTTISNNWA
ncbi:MAG: right-handed parallel beta-helix repeat-containing protein, partial [Pirellulales bacterium]|nr:right-handed parallel beta-helix repeat-containing protein [Pirellulales bacterium]